MRPAAAAAALLLAACASAPPPPTSTVPAAVASTGLPALANAGFEAPPVPGRGCVPSWNCSTHADGTAYRFAIDDTSATEGRHSLSIERLKPEPWSIVTQTLPAKAFQGRRVRFSLAVRTDSVGGGGAGPWLLLNGGGRVLDHQVRHVTGTTGWERHVIEVLVPADAEHLSVGATLEGPGKAWFDDARLELVTGR